MNTTPAPEHNPQPVAPAGAEPADVLDSLTELDPADAPVVAESLAAELARDLEGVSADGAPPAEPPSPGEHGEGLP